MTAGGSVAAGNHGPAHHAAESGALPKRIVTRAIVPQEFEYYGMTPVTLGHPQQENDSVLTQFKCQTLAAGSSEHNHLLSSLVWQPAF